LKSSRANAIAGLLLTMLAKKFGYWDARVPGENETESRELEKSSANLRAGVTAEERLKKKIAVVKSE
jgi:hypothetical protein